jgi:hypothetical protein
MKVETNKVRALLSNVGSANQRIYSSKTKRVYPFDIWGDEVYVHYSWKYVKLTLDELMQKVESGEIEVHTVMK